MEQQAKQEKTEPIQVTTKNPKKVEAGKRLAEYNRKKREELKTMQKNEPQVKDSSFTEFVESENIGYGVAAIATIAVIGGFYFYRNQNNNSQIEIRNDSNEKKTKSFVEKFSMD